MVDRRALPVTDRTEARPRRLAARCATALVAQVQVSGLPPRSCQVRNVSVGGLFIATDAACDPASRLTVRLTLPAGRSAAVDARVVHVLPVDRARSFGLTAGIGVQFQELDHAAKAFVSELVDWAVAHSPGPRVARIRPGADTSAVRREPLLGLLLGYIDGQRNLDALAQELALEPDTIERMLGELASRGVVELASRASMPPAASRNGRSPSPSGSQRTSSSRAPGAVFADVTAAAEAARVAATSSTRPSQPSPARASGRPGPSQPTAPARAASVRPSGSPPAGRVGSRQPPATARPPSIRPSGAPRPSQPLGAAAQILAQAEAAFTAGRALEASRHLKLLAAMTFDDPGIAQRAGALRQQVLRDVAVELERQAIHEEGRKHWDKAAECWLRVAEGRPEDSLPLQRAVLAQLQAGVEPRVAVETARRAVQLAPTVAEVHRTLAKAYMAADMQASAKQAMEAARRCGASSEPGEEAITTALLKRLLTYGR
jgi:Tfp pilus assembly protein PilZ